jgi:chromosome segregation ATPase
MSSFTKISSYRMGPPRFGTRKHTFDNSVTTYQLTPEELEQYKAGKSIDEILREQEEMKNTINLTVEEYVELKNEGLSDSEIAESIGLELKQLHNWKYHRRDKIKNYQNSIENSENSVQNENEYKTTTGDTKNEYEAILEEIKALKDENERLKREVINAHKLVSEKEEEIARLQELFETTMTDKERLHKENLILENQIQRLKEANDELTAKNERYFADLMRLEQEVKGLRIYALQKLHVDVYGEGRESICRTS